MAKNKFGSKLGVVMAAAGSAVGLGNVWRFPYLAGENGGGAFLLVYIICVLVIGIPVMMSEFVIGRRGGGNAVGAMRSLSGGRKWDWLGAICILCSILILAFYLVVTGWCVKFFLLSLFGTAPADWINTLIALGLNVLILGLGVEKGIEKVSTVLMPLLLVLLVMLVVRSLTLPNSGEGIRFLFEPDFTKITTDVWLAALSQSFFTLSLGMGCMLTYASYMKKEQNLWSTAAQVASIDTLVAILAGVAVFPAVFSLGFSPTEGPQLVFDVLPEVFHSMPGGSVFGVLFFLLLLIAAVTSAISIQEIQVAYLHEQHQMSRSKALVWTTAVAFALAMLCSLSLDGSLSIGGRGLFDWFDYLTSKFLMPLGAIGFVLYLGWFYPTEESRDEIKQGSEGREWLFQTWLWTIRTVVPAGIFIIFLHGLGVF